MRSNWTKPVAALTAVWVSAFSTQNAVAEGCGDAEADCGGKVSAECLRYGAGSQEVSAAPESCEAQFDAYRACLTAFAARCGAPSGVTPPPLRSDSPPPKTAPRAVFPPPPGHRIVAEAAIDGRPLAFLRSDAPVRWTEADRIARASGWRLAVIDSAQKNNAVYNVLSRYQELFHPTPGPLFTTWFFGPWIGGRQLDPASPANAGWSWGPDLETGLDQPIGYTHWFLDNPNDYGGPESHIHYFCINQPTCDTWNDSKDDSLVHGYIVEQEN
ncbi:MAG: hypothetical protein KTR21_07270 [Rhodobacteraceae bacterium]|nr:hypothetical protein [Paracoccaceae bacterium]